MRNFFFLLLGVFFAVQVQGQENPLKVFISRLESGGCKCAMGTEAEPAKTNRAWCMMKAKGKEQGRRYDFLLYKKENGDQAIVMQNTPLCGTEYCANSLVFYDLADSGFVKTDFVIIEGEVSDALRDGYFFDRLILGQNPPPTLMYQILNDTCILVTRADSRTVNYTEPGHVAQYGAFVGSVHHNLFQGRWIPESSKIAMMQLPVWKKLKTGFDNEGHIIDPRGYTEVHAAPDAGSAIRGVMYAFVEVCYKTPAKNEEWVTVVGRNGLRGYIPLASVDGHAVTK